MGVLVDSGVVIDLERRNAPLSVLLESDLDESFALAAISASELLVGVLRADTHERRLRREAFVEGVLARLPVLPFDLPIARVHTDIGVRLFAAGQRIGAHDLLIAATALTHGYAVLTANLREFQRVPGLVVRQPSW